MDALSNFALGFSVAASLSNLAYCFFGVFVGTFIGVLPGIGALAAISMLLPLTFYLDSTGALIMLAGIFYGAEYGGSIASILLNLPGTTSSAVTCLDGYPMAKQGRAGVALFITAIASFIGGSIGIIVLMLMAPLLAELAIAFGPADYFSVMLLGLVAASSMTQDAPLKGASMVVLGLLLGCVGTDVNSGIQRYTLGISSLFDGLSLIAIAMGLFGIAEVIESVGAGRGELLAKKVTFRSMIPTWLEVRRSGKPVVRGAAIGTFFGALPGTGQTVASFISYATEKRASKTPDLFGTGMVEGIAGPESANNAAAQAAFIPTLTLAIPGSASMALMLGAMMIHGIAPGPGLMRNHPDLFWGLVVSFWIGNVMLLILNIPLIGLWIRLLQIPYDLLFPAIVCFVCIGVYSVSFNTFDIMMLLLFGIIGYFVRILGYSPAPLLLGFVLGPLMEENFRRALLLSGGNGLVFFKEPISAAAIGISAVMLLISLRRSLQHRPN